MPFITIAISPDSLPVIERHVQRPAKVASALAAALTQALVETEADIEDCLLTGGAQGMKRNGGLPLAVRSGALRQSVKHGKESPLVGWVGTTNQSPAAAYAKVMLGPDKWHIVPKNAKHLWLPIADNLNPSGLARMSPREAMSVTSPSGKKLLRIFKSHAGNLVAFLPDFAEGVDGGGGFGAIATGARYKRGTKSGRKAGELKGKLLFVLKDSVDVQGSDALAQGVRAKTPRIRELLQAALHEPA